MKMRIVFLICFILASVIVTAAQAKTVTNADLEKYSRERVKAEKDLRENYAKLGFSSPEEFERRNTADAKERAELASRLRQESEQRARLEAEREANASLAAAYYNYSRVQIEPQTENTVYFWSYGHRYRFLPRQTQYQQPGYFAGGQFWPTGSRTAPQPMFRIRPRN